MMIIRVMGGLGNQLQQYALYQKLIYLGKEARLDFSWFSDEKPQTGALTKRELELCYFDGLPMKEASAQEIESVLGRQYGEPERLLAKVKRKLIPSSNPVFTESRIYHPEIFTWEKKYLVGYFACEKYYADVLARLREILHFPASPNEKNREILKEIQETESVSLHVRRGDYLDPANAALFGNICTDAYYDSAVACLSQRYPDARFFVFSDDTEYVRAKYQGERYRIIDWNHGKDSFYDMMLMSFCRHNICANSTFSFWGARLNRHQDKTMIRPSIHRINQPCSPDEMKRLWEGWTLITPQGILI